MYKKEPPKHIIISHVYSSHNKGDAALTSVLIQDVKKRFPQATLHILKLAFSADDKKDFEGVVEQPAFMYYALNKYRNLVLKLAYVIYMLLSTLLWAWWFRWTGHKLYLPATLRKTALAYAEADLIVAVGGGYLRSRKGVMNRLNIPLLLHPLLFGWLLGKPTVLYSQSVGPFVNGYEGRLVAFVLRRMTLIMLREDTSMQLLASLGVRDNVVRAIDSGFLLQGTGKKLNVRKQYHLPKHALLIGVTVRAWLQGDAQIKYEQAVAKALDTIVEKLGAHVLFIPQVTADKGDDDRITSRQVHAYMRNADSATTIEDEPNHHKIKAMYDNLDFLLGTRFHSVIFSLTSYVPVLAIEYEHKTSGIMHDLKLDEWVIKIEDVTTAKLTQKLQALVRDSKDYKTHLQAYLPPYLQKAELSAVLLEESYYNSKTTS